MVAETIVPPAPENVRRFQLSWRLVLPVLAFLPAVVTALLIKSSAVNVPFWDDWERVPYIQMWQEGTLTLKALYAPHIDHRMFFPRVLMLICNELSGGDLRVEIAMNFLIVLLAAIGVVMLLRRTLAAEQPLPWALIFTINLLLFTPMQYENWLWAVQTAFFLPMTCLVWALVAVVTPWRWWVRLLVALSLALVATHSFGHGFAIWPAVFGVALLRRDFGASRKDRTRFLLLWVLAAVVTLTCYVGLDFTNVSHSSHSYGQEPGAPPPSAVNGGKVLENPGRFVQYVLVLAGSLFSRFHLIHPVPLATGIGGGFLMLLSALGVAAVWLRLRRPNDERWDRLLPWLALAFASLLGLAAIAYGRMAMELQFVRATSPRYGSIALYLPVSLIVAVALMIQPWLRHKTTAVRWHMLSGWAAGALLVFIMPGWMYGATMMELCRQNRLEAQASLLFLNHFQPEYAHRIDGGTAFVRPLANYLNQRGQLRPALVESLEIDPFRPLRQPRPSHQAKVEKFEHLADGSWQISGFASHQKRSADLVLLTSSGSDKSERIVAVIEAGRTLIGHPYLGDLFHIGREGHEREASFRFQKILPAKTVEKLLQNRPLRLRTWIFDVQSLRAYRIAGEWTVDAEGQPVHVSTKAPSADTTE